MCDTEQFSNLVLIDMRTDHAQTSDNTCRTVADIYLTWNIVEVDPLTVLPCNDTLGTQNDTVLNGVLKLIQAGRDFFLSELLGSLTAKAFKYFVSMMMVMSLMMMIMVMATAGTIVTVVMVVVVFMIMVVLVMVIMIVMIVVVMPVLVIMLVTAAGAILTVLVMVIMIVMIVVMLMLMIMIVATAGTLVTMLMMVLMRQAFQFSFDGVLAFHGFQQLCAGELTPRGNDDGCGRIVFT